MKTYRKRQTSTVTAVRLDLDMDGFNYKKWGSLQTCKPGDWIVSDGQDTWTVDAESFALTYEEASPGVYRKTAVVYAERSETSGTLETKEGSTSYEAGDYLVYNSPNRGDGYCVKADRFEANYEPVDSA